MIWLAVIVLIVIALYYIGNNSQKKELQIMEAKSYGNATDFEVNWNGKNEVESIRDDGYVIYKTNWVTSSEKDEIGFYGQKWYSQNNKYCVVFLPHFEEEDYNLALVHVNLKTILYKIKLQRPHRCRVTNEGFVVCEDWLGYDKPNCKIYIIDNKGNIINEKGHNTGIGDVFEFIDNEKSFKYNINSSGKIHLLHLK